MTEDVQDYLASGEEITHQWEGKISDGERSESEGMLVATDRRLAYLADGSFKDIDYTHISSIESDTNEVHDVPWSAVLTGLMVAFGVIGVLKGLAGGNLGGILFGVVLLVISYLLYQLSSEDESDNKPTVKQSVTVVTDDVRENEINFQTTQNIGADLSKTIRDRA